MRLLTIILDTDKIEKMLRKLYHYLYYCYYNLVSDKVDYRADGASSVLTVFDTSILVAVYLHLSMAIGRKSLAPTIEGLGLFFIGVALGVLNWIYFVKNENYQVAVSESKDSSKLLIIFVGILLLILPLPLFIYSCVKMSFYLRSQ
jgi:hypothetical protein